jgi:2-polyprenyl-3-methyl-5-hydroxy-6-metoxy-1,4-benzoquinol methylase
LRKINLQKLMNTLYESMDYFVSFPPESSMNFEEEYHEIATDPDGMKRDLLNEREFSLSAVKEVTTYLANLKPGRILDIGCGPGWILSSLSENWDKHGIEISKFASDHASQFGEIHNGTLVDYEFNGHPFDVIHMYHVIEHIEDPVGALKKIFDMLAPGGKLILGTPDFDSAAARRYGENFRMLHDPTHISLFSADSMHRCLRDLGFQIKFVEYPYFDTPWFTKENLLCVLEEDRVSPHFMAQS